MKTFLDNLEYYYLWRLENSTYNTEHLDIWLYATESAAPVPLVIGGIDLGPASENVARACGLGAHIQFKQVWTYFVVDESGFIDDDGFVEAAPFLSSSSSSAFLKIAPTLLNVGYGKTLFGDLTHYRLMTADAIFHVLAALPPEIKQIQCVGSN